MLELGGNSPLVVLADADVDAASSAGAFGSFLHSGQICMATSRHLVHEDVVEDYLRALAEPRTSACRSAIPTPSRSRSGRSSTSGRSTASSGSSTRASPPAPRSSPGGRADGLFFPPTVLRDVTPSMPAFAEETFGPVAPVTAFRDDDEAVELANATGYGLAAAVQGERGHADRVAARLRAGMVHVNDQTVNEEDPAPFGGFGISGNASHCGGPANLEAFTTWQWRTSRDDPAPFPF